MEGISPFQSGRPLLSEITADKLNRILAEIKRNRPVVAAPLSARVTGDGTHISLRQSSAAGGGTATQATTRPFQLSIVNAGETETPEWKVRVLPSTLAGGSSTDLDFTLADNPPYLLEAAVGVLQGGITIDAEGVITSRWLEIVETLTPDTATDFHVEIGTVAYDEENETWSVENSRYGPIDANVCRDWFSNPPSYSVTFFAVSPY
jgi:hypothetical protein